MIMQNITESFEYVLIARIECMKYVSNITVNQSSVHNNYV